MRSRTLMRPMFRIGGSAGTGITSGLDRPGYQRTRWSIDARFFIQRPMTSPAPAVDKKPTGIGMGTIPGFLTGLGLNLATLSTNRKYIF